MRSTSLPENTGPAVPDAFGPFRVLHQTGAGALGPVYRAYDPDQDRLVAVKVFALDLPPDQVDALVARLQDLIALDLTHPAVAAPVAAGVSGGSAYLAQDFAAADSLDTVMREFGAASPGDAARVTGQIAGALDSAAAFGVYHGGLHPRDLLLTADDARVTGLGVAQALEAIGVASPVRAPYAAPERMRGGRWDRRADVYSLAVLATEIMTGRAPAGLVALDELLRGAATDLRTFGGVLAKGMAERPEDRYDTATALADALKAAVEPLRAATAASTPAASEPATAGRTGDRTLVAPRLPLEEPLLVSEALLPGDELTPTEVATRWDPPLMTFGAGDEPELTLARPATGDTDPTRPDWEIPASNRLTVADGDGDIGVRVHADPQLDERHARQGAAGAADETALVATSIGRSGARVGRRDETPMNGGRAASAAFPLATSPVATAAVEPATSPVWPIPLAWMVGLIMGIAVGFFIFGNRTASDRVAESPVAATTTAAVTPAPVAGPPPSSPNPTAASSAEGGATATAGSVPPPAPERNNSADVVPPASGRALAEAAGAPERREPPPSRSTGAASAATADATSRRASAGRLLVRSSPAGARVQVDGRDVGATPLTLRSLALGSHTIRLTRRGFAAEERRVTMSASQPAQSVIVDLSPTRDRVIAPVASEGVAARPPTTGGAGQLIVESRPAGAAVYIDGRRVGTTPATVDNVRVGQHTVFLELDGFRGWSRLVQLGAGENHLVSATLEP